MYLNDKKQTHQFVKEITKVVTGVIAYSGNVTIERKDRILGSAFKQQFNLKLSSSNWSILCDMKHLSRAPGLYELNVDFNMTAGVQKECSCFLEFELGKWSSKNYVLMPGAVYNGNRFRCFKTPYPPLITNKNEMGVNFETTITDVPRLSNISKASKIDLLAGDMSTPAIGIYNPQSKSGFLLITEQETRYGAVGISLEENLEQEKAYIKIASPGIRERKYSSCSMDSVKSDDRGRDIMVGDVQKLKVRVHSFDCKDIPEFFNFFAGKRKELSGKVVLENTIPFSHTWHIQESTYNSERWNNDGDYYYSFPTDYMNNIMDYQLGWIGGLMCTHAMILEGNRISRERAVKNLDMVFTKTQAPSGFFYGSGNNGNFYGDGIWEHHWPHNMHSVRKSGDALYFMLKQCMALEKTDSSWRTPTHWVQGIVKLADVFTGLWEKYGQFGQIIDIETGDILVGGSTAGAIVPAGLALAAAYFGQNKYLFAAAQAAEYYYHRDTLSGVTTGGPIEILQCPDSESAFALVESFVGLYEATLEEKWLKMAFDASMQYSTWCVSYNYKWPEGSEFAKLGIKSAGSVIANVQNKCSTPGICTFSGDSLLKLYRATGNAFFLELLQETAHNLPQYLSREDRPVTAWDGRKMPAGWMNERVNMSDWEGKDKIGEVFYCYCWCEVSNMLTWAEIPGIYIQSDTGFICIFDHVEVSVINKSMNSMVISIKNPTKYDAVIKVFTEKSTDLKKPLHQNWLYGCKKVNISAGGEVTVDITQY